MQDFDKKNFTIIKESKYGKNIIIPEGVFVCAILFELILTLFVQHKSEERHVKEKNNGEPSIFLLQIFLLYKI